MVAGNTILCVAITNANGDASCSTSGNLLPLLLARGYDAQFAGSASLKPASAHAPLILKVKSP